MRIYEAMEGACEEVTRAGAVGRISADFYTVYPPGIPVIVPGERITEEILGKVKEKVLLVVAGREISTEKLDGK